MTIVVLLLAAVAAASAALNLLQLRRARRVAAAPRMERAKAPSPKCVGADHPYRSAGRPSAVPEPPENGGSSVQSPEPTGITGMFRYPLVLWKCPVCKAEGTHFSVWTCWDKSDAKSYPSCVKLGARHHLHVKCGVCEADVAYQAVGEDFVQVWPKPRRETE